MEKFVLCVHDVFGNCPATDYVTVFGNDFVSAVEGQKEKIAKCAYNEGFVKKVEIIDSGSETIMNHLPSGGRKKEMHWVDMQLDCTTKYIESSPQYKKYKTVIRVWER